MAELSGLNLNQHLSIIMDEFAAHKSIYGYPSHKIYRGFEGVDFSVPFHTKRAATPLGPASGPHTQMAHNIIQSFLGGSRIMELKTVQILDQLEISRPCIDIRNIGYNVEWSQEITLEASYQEYVTAWVLLKLLEESQILGVPKDEPFYNTVFDLSVGYDLKGIASDRVRNWIDKMMNAEEAINALLGSLPPRFAQYKNVSISPHIADSITLSTFHGCPRDEIEAIVEHLIGEHGLHVIVKMNPTVLGYEYVSQTLRDDLGYKQIILDPDAFERDLNFDDAVAMMKRLEMFAAQHDRRVGAKFSNTLVVKNNQNIFDEKMMYLSGVPLHLLAMNGMRRFRAAMGAHFHISFAAGIDQFNFVDAVACNMVPVTTCTDLLKTGGYTRLFNYLQRLHKAMKAAKCASVEEYIINRAGIFEISAAGAINTEQIVPTLLGNPRYHYDKNSKSPPKTDGRLTLFDCLTCDKCIPVCPNAANFVIPIAPRSISVTNYRITEGAFTPVPGDDLVLSKKHQIGNWADFCNECGNCDTYCPELGGPYVQKPRFFFTEVTYAAFSEHDGFCFPEQNSIIGRIEGQEYRLRLERDCFVWASDQFELTLSAEDDSLIIGNTDRDSVIDMRPYHIMKILLDSISANHWSMLS